MKKTLFLAMGLISITTFAQVGRVGINSESPRATLDIVGKPFTGDAEDKKFSRGVILPHISDAQKAEFTDKTEGLMIWNTTKKCIDYWNGTEWQCYGGTNINTTPPTTTPQQSWSCEETITEEYRTLGVSAGEFQNNSAPYPYCDTLGYVFNQTKVIKKQTKTTDRDLSGTLINEGELQTCVIDMRGLSNENDAHYYKLITTTTNKCAKL